MVTRCDHWSFARALEVVFQPGPDRSLTVVWSLLDEAQARTIPLEPRRNFEGCELVRLCSWCRAVHMRTRWQPLEVAASALGLLDRAILRLGAWEVLFSDEIPDAVAISEAVALATDLSTDESPGFVNGLLGRLAEVKATIV